MKSFSRQYAILVLSFGILSLNSCAENKGEVDVIHFPNCDIYPVFLNPPREGVSSAVWSPDGGSFLFALKGDLWTISPYGEKLTRITDIEGAEVSFQYCPVPGTNKLVFRHSDMGMGQGWSIYTFSPGQGEPKRIKELGTMGPYPFWSSDGKQLVLDNGDAFYTMAPEGGELKPISNNQGWRSVSGVGVSRIRNVIYYAQQFSTPALPDALWESRLSSIPISGGDPTLIWEVPMRLGAVGISESWDGSMLALTAEYPGTRLGYRNIFLMPSDGGEPVLLTDFDYFGAEPQGVDWSPDGKQLVVMLGEPHGIHRVELKPQFFTQGVIE